MSGEASNAGNGGATETRPVFATITLELTDLLTGALKVTGTFPSLDTALNMLAQATREIEAQWRLQRAEQYQAQQREAARIEAIRRDLANRV
jgi:hypothetical protein